MQVASQATVTLRALWGLSRGSPAAHQELLPTLGNTENPRVSNLLRYLRSKVFGLAVLQPPPTNEFSGDAPALGPHAGGFRLASEANTKKAATRPFVDTPEDWDRIQHVGFET